MLILLIQAFRKQKIPDSQKADSYEICGEVGK